MKVWALGFKIRLALVPLARFYSSDIAPPSTGNLLFSLNLFTPTVLHVCPQGNDQIEAKKKAAGGNT
jgi:hypothetical protein